MQSSVSSTQNTPASAAWPSKLWWLAGGVLLALCILIQMPAVWLVNQFMPNSPYIQQVSGNIWQGSAVTQISAQKLNQQVAQPVNSAQPLMATVTWKLKPLSLFIGKVSADINIDSGQTRLEGQVSRGFNSLSVSNLSGKIEKQALMSIVNWKLPDAPIQVNAVSATLHESKGFVNVDGQLTWSGGELGYPNGNKTYTLILPAMRAELSEETKGERQVMHANLVDNNSKRLGDIYLESSGMMDVGLTQRMLEHMPSYEGSAPSDTTVVSVRQPLFGSATGETGSEGAR